MAQPNTEHHMPNLICSEEDLVKLLQNLDASKSPGPDGIHPRVLKEMCCELSLPLMNLFNNSLEAGTDPIRNNGNKAEYQLFIRMVKKTMQETIDQ